MCIRRSLAALVVFGASSIASAEEPVASRLWEVQLMKNNKGQMWCEAHMTGQNPAGGGRYKVRLWVNGQDGTIEVFHPGGELNAKTADVYMDGKFKVMTRPITQMHSDDQAVLTMTLNYDNFTQKFIPNLERGRTMEIRVGPRTYLTAVEGFKAVSDKMGNCHELMLRAKGKS